MDRLTRSGKVRADEVAKAPNEYAELLLGWMRVQETSQDMINVANANMDIINVLKRMEPVRVTHMRNMIKLKQLMEKKEQGNGQQENQTTGQCD